MKEMKTFEIEQMDREVGGEWACIVTCVAGCAAAEVVVPGGIALSAYATVGAAL